MSAVWVVRSASGSILYVNLHELSRGDAAYAADIGYVVTRETLLTPEMAAVIAAAKAWADNEDVRGAKLYAAVTTLRAQEGA